MEPTANLNMTINSISDRKFVIKTIVSDDGSILRAHLRHKINLNDLDDKDQLPTWIYEPEFLADPSHQVKSVSKHFYA